MLFLIFNISGCSQSHENESADKTFLKLEDVLQAFKESQIRLEKTNISAEKYELAGKTPSIYEIKGSKGSYVMVYVFSNHDDREKAYHDLNCDFEKETKFFKDLLSEEYPLLQKYNAKNTLIIYIPKVVDHISINEEESKTIENTVFYKVNEGKELIFYGESKNWEARIVVKYYEHWWKEDNGKIQYDSYSERSSHLKYKGTETIKDVKFSYELHGPNGVNSGSRSGIEIRKDREINLFKTRSNGSSSRPDNVYELNIKWIGKEETINLKALDTHDI